MTDENDPHPQLFELASDVLNQLDSGDDGVLKHVFRLEVGALTLLGHRPMLDQCVGCGREKTLTNIRVNFGLHAGGIYCAACRKGKTDVVSLSSETMRLLTEISQPEKTQTFELPEKCRGELRKFLDKYIAHHLGFRPRLQKYVTGIKN